MIRVLTKSLCFVVAVALVLVPEHSACAGENGHDMGDRGRRSGAVLYKVRTDVTEAQLGELEKELSTRDARRLKDISRIGLRLDVCRGLAISEEQLCLELLRTGAVEFAEPDYCVTTAGTPNDPQYGQEWHHTTINSPAAWDMTTGTSTVVVAVVDSGVEATHPDLAANMRLPGYNCVDNGTNSGPNPSSGGWHGTFTAGVAAAVGNNNAGVAGIAWNVKILPVCALYPDGSGYISDVAEGITWAADHGAKVVNVSLITSGSSAINTAGQYVRGKGGLLFVAAENNGINPGFSDYASYVTVGATDQNDAKTSWSNYGNYIDVVAPGIDIRSTYTNATYATGWGTSFAAPVVSGIAALIWSLNTNFTPPQVENFIFSTCVDLGSTGDDSTFGHGRVNAAAAVAAAKNYLDTLDANGNSIPDVWEIKYFGITNSVPGSATNDPDDDGLNNLSEYIAGTDPTNSASCVQCLVQALHGNGFSIEFQSVSGRLYSVKYRDAMLATNWATLTNGMPGINGILNVTDTNSLPARFYRIGVKLE